MNPLPFLAALPAALAVFIILEYTARSPWPKLAAKTLCSLLFLAAALVSVGAPLGVPVAYEWFAAAFVLSLLGDVLLAFPMKRSFSLGLGAFLLAQCLFTAALSLRWGASFIDLGVLALFVGGTLTTLWNARGMDYGKMERPVTVYAIAVSMMAAKAVSGTYLSGGIAAWLAAAGGILFWASDVVLAFVVFNRKKPACLRAVNLVLYYMGQGLLAGSLWV
jgi:uncharacterized membrane protein YhhN